MANLNNNNVQGGAQFGEIGVMSNAISRANLLRGRFSPTTEVVHSHYAVTETKFRTLCDKCGDCLKACETGILTNGNDGFPILRFGHAKCTFCGACAEACKTGALNVAKARDWKVSAHIKTSCLSLNGITYRSCEEACEANAV